MAFSPDDHAFAMMNGEDEIVRMMNLTDYTADRDLWVLAPLLTALKDQDTFYVRVRAAKALGAIKDAHAVEPLIAMLEDEDPDALHYSDDGRRVSWPPLGRKPEAFPHVAPGGPPRPWPAARAQPQGHSATPQSLARCAPTGTIAPREACPLACCLGRFQDTLLKALAHTCLVHCLYVDVLICLVGSPIRQVIELIS